MVPELPDPSPAAGVGFGAAACSGAPWEELLPLFAPLLPLPDPLPLPLVLGPVTGACEPLLLLGDGLAAPEPPPSSELAPRCPESEAVEPGAPLDEPELDEPELELEDPEPPEFPGLFDPVSFPGGVLSFEFAGCCCGGEDGGLFSGGLCAGGLF